MNIRSILKKLRRLAMIRERSTTYVSKADEEYSKCAYGIIRAVIIFKVGLSLKSSILQEV